MNKNLKASVILSVYNTQKYLRECLESILNQSLKELEIICVNDGSTDDSLNILKEYAKKDARISIITQPNLGAGAARNTGLKAVLASGGGGGQFISFLDSDDFFAPHMFEVAVKQMEQDNSDILSFAFNVFDEKKGRITYIANTQKTTLMDAKISQKGLFNIAPNAWSKLFRTDFLKRHNIQFLNTKIANDITFTLTLMALASKISFINEPLATYRENRKGNISLSRGRYIDEYFKAILAIKENLIKHDLFWKLKGEFDSFLVSSGTYELNCASSFESINDSLLKFGELFGSEVGGKIKEKIFERKNLRRLKRRILKEKIALFFKKFQV